MKKYIIAGALVVAGLVAFLSSVSMAPVEQPQDTQLGGITRSVTYSTSSIPTSSAVQVLAPSRAVFRRISIEPETISATVFCFAGTTSTVKRQAGIPLRDYAESAYVFSAEMGNLWSGPISCISDTTGTANLLLTEEHFE